MTGLHAAVVNTGPVSGWQLLTPTVARRVMPRTGLHAYVRAAGDQHAWWVECNAQQVVADTCPDPADAITAADTAMLGLLRAAVRGAR